MSKYVTNTQLGGDGTAKKTLTARMFYTETSPSGAGDAIHFGRALQQESAERQKSIGALGAKLLHADMTIKKLEANIETQKVCDEVLTAALAEKDEQISVLKKSLSDLEERATSLQKASVDLEEKTNNLCSILQNFKRETKAAWWFAPWGPGFDTAKDEYQKYTPALGDDFYDVDKCMSSTAPDMIDGRQMTTKQTSEQDSSNHTPIHTPNEIPQENLESTFQSMNI
jgi:uncharacterized coiled-coil protein SlyX